MKFHARSDTGIFLSILQKKIIEDRWWLLISNVPKLKEKKERTHTTQKYSKIGNW